MEDYRSEDTLIFYGLTPGKAKFSVVQKALKEFFEKKKALDLIHSDDETFRYPVTSTYALLGLKDEAIRNIELGIRDGFKDVGNYD